MHRDSRDITLLTRNLLFNLIAIDAGTLRVKFSLAAKPEISASCLLSSHGNELLLSDDMVGEV